MNDAQWYFVEEFAEEYHIGRLSRRDLLRRVLLITGSTAVTASTLLSLGCGSKSPSPSNTNSAPTPHPPSPASVTAPALSPASNIGAATMPPTSQSDALIVQPEDPAIRAQKVQFPGAAGPIFGYLAARRYAKEGYAALAVDLVSREGGTDKYASDPAQIPAILSRIAPAGLVADLNAGLTYLKIVDGVRKDGFGVTGFCFGGNQTFALAVASPDMRAAVPYYGTVNPQDLAKSQAAFLNFYGETDTRVTSQAQTVAQALRQAGRPAEVHIEPGAAHAFFRNNGASYNPTAARDAWPRTLAWFAKYLAT